MRFRLRTLLIVLTVGPMVLALPWINPRLALVILSFVPYAAFMIWQLRLRNAAKK
jgi:hypothetical protein